MPRNSADQRRLRMVTSLSPYAVNDTGFHGSPAYVNLRWPQQFSDAILKLFRNTCGDQRALSHAAQRKDVGPVIHGDAANLLRRRIAEGLEHGAGGGLHAQLERLVSVRCRDGLRCVPGVNDTLWGSHPLITGARIIA